MGKECMSDAELDHCLMLFGQLPILSTENQEHCEEILRKVIKCLGARDIVEVMYIRHFVNADWIVNRLNRHGAVALERRFRQSLEYQVLRLKQLKARKEAKASNNAEIKTLQPADIANLVGLEETILNTVSDIDELLRRKATELDHNRALEKSMAFQEALNKLIVSQTAIRDNALKQLENYRFGLGSQTSQISEIIIETEYEEIKGQPEEVPAPPVVPAEEASTNDVATQNRSESAQ